MSVRSFVKGSLLDAQDLVSCVTAALRVESPLIASPRAALDQWARASVQVMSGRKGGRPCLYATRNRTWIEWAFFAALYLKKMGEHPVVILSGAELKKVYRADRLLPLLGYSFPRGVVKLQGIEVVDLDAMAGGDGPVDADAQEFATAMARTVAAYDCRVEEGERHYFVEEYQNAIEAARANLEHHVSVFEKIISSYRIERVIAPSGLIGMTPAVLFAARRRGVPAYFVEGWAWRKGHLIWNRDRPALDYDVEGWLGASGEWNEEKERDASDFKKFQEHERVLRDDWFVGFYVVQRAPKSTTLQEPLATFLASPGPLFLMGTNVIGDSATLRRGGVFANQKEWLECIIDHFRSRPDHRLLIRAHPDEVSPKARIKLGAYLARLAEGLPNVLVLPGQDKTSTYSLIEHCTAGLVWVSNIGVDMVIRNKPVLAAGRAAYANLGIVPGFQSREEYFAIIDAWATAPAPPTAEQVLAAKKYQRLVFKDISLCATGPNYISHEYRIGSQPMHEEQQIFFEIMVGMRDNYGRPV